MIYRNFQNIELSALGLGMMRLPVIDGDDSKVDEKTAEKMIDFAYKSGVNYYDTAWGYHSGNSELAAGTQAKTKAPQSFDYSALYGRGDR